MHYKGKVYISFSGGKDSTVLLDIARRLFPDIEAVYIDTGLEHPELRDFVKTIDNVTWLKPEMNFRKVIEQYGYPLISKEVANAIYYYRKILSVGQLRDLMTTANILKNMGKPFLCKDGNG